MNEMNKLESWRSERGSGDRGVIRLHPSRIIPAALSTFYDSDQ